MLTRAFETLSLHSAVLTAGDAIDQSLGVTLQISTLAAAGMFEDAHMLIAMTLDP